jgi:hypothetical protein
MKIHPNQEINQMLKNGTAKVISHTALPQRYFDMEQWLPNEVAVNVGTSGLLSGVSAAAGLAYGAPPPPPVTPPATPPAQTPAQTLVAQPEVYDKTNMAFLKVEAALPPTEPAKQAGAELVQNAPILPDSGLAASADAGLHDPALLAAANAEPVAVPGAAVPWGNGPIAAAAPLDAPVTPAYASPPDVAPVDAAGSASSDAQKSPADTPQDATPIAAAAPLDATGAAVYASPPDVAPVDAAGSASSDAQKSPADTPQDATPIAAAAALDALGTSAAALRPDDLPDAPAAALRSDSVPEAPAAAAAPNGAPEAPAAAADGAIDPLQPEDAPDSPAAMAHPDARPGVEIEILQPESAPGGLVAVLHFRSDPDGLVFGGSAESLSFQSETGVAQSKDYAIEEEDPSCPPYVNFTCFNRLGLTIKNLTNLLDSDEDFELNIIDCNSKDNSWDYIQSLTDSRIKSRIRFEKNCGPIFAVNFALSRRKPNQYFIVMDSDTFIKSKNWIARFMEVFEAFPEVGLLGLMRDNPYPRYLPPIIPRVNGAISYLELKNADINAQMDFIPGQLQCLRPALIREIGYWSEENGFGDAEISPRIVHYTNFKVGFLTTIEIDMSQKLTCDECMGRDICKLSRSIGDCFSMSRLYNKNESFVTKNTWKFKQTFEELQAGQRTAYCASIHDPESVRTHLYNADWAYDNFNHYIINAN